MPKNKLENAPPNKNKMFLKPTLGLLILFLMTSLVFLRAGSINKKVEFAIKTKERINSDDDFYRAPFVLDRDFQLLEYLRKHYPYGANINLLLDNNHPARRQRIMLALLPKYRITKNALLIICAKDRIEPTDKLLAIGDKFLLVKGIRRAAGGSY